MAGTLASELSRGLATTGEKRRERESRAGEEPAPRLSDPLLSSFPSTPSLSPFRMNSGKTPTVESLLSGKYIKIMFFVLWSEVWSSL